MRCDPISPDETRHGPPPAPYFSPLTIQTASHASYSFTRHTATSCPGSIASVNRRSSGRDVITQSVRTTPLTPSAILPAHRQPLLSYSLRYTSVCAGGHKPCTTIPGPTIRTYECNQGHQGPWVLDATADWLVELLLADAEADANRGTSSQPAILQHTRPSQS